MRKLQTKNITVTRCVVLLAISIITFSAGPAAAHELCASLEQAQKIQDFYAENLGAMPPVAARKLGMPEAVVVSGMAAGQSVSTKADAFADVWALMNSWEPVTFLIIKSGNVFEIASSIGIGTPSEISDFFNIAYEQPLRGHLRPDLYASITAVAIPGEDDAVGRGILFYDADGASIFGAFMADDAGEAEVAKFDAVVELMKTRTPVCQES